MSDDDMIRRGDVASLLLQHAEYRRDCAWKADQAEHDTWADMNREAAEALLGVRATIRALPAVQPDAAAIRAAVLREAIAALIRKEQGQLLSDYDVHPEIFKNDPETGQAVWDLTDAILALIDNTAKETK